VVVVLVVLAAIYVKMNDAGADAIFRGSDIYIVVGAVLALAVLKIFYSHRNKK
jgi:Na+-translocating ferredoxin:NAD+ oxidoreductase RnfA subunit